MTNCLQPFSAVNSALSRCVFNGRPSAAFSTHYILNKKYVLWNMYLPNAVANCHSILYTIIPNSRLPRHVRHYSTDDIMENQQFITVQTVSMVFSRRLLHSAQFCTLIITVLLPYDSPPARTSTIQLFSKISHAKLGTANLIHIVKLYYYCYYYTFSFRSI